jgi:hypothetical protein
VSPGDVLYVGRYMTLGSTQGVTPDPSASLLTLRVLSVSSPGDVECEALNTATLSGLVTLSHPGGQQQQRQAADATAAALGEAGVEWGGCGSGAAAAGAGGAPALGRGADGSANYSLPILSTSDVEALKVQSTAHNSSWVLPDGEQEGRHWGSGCGVPGCNGEGVIRRGRACQ